MTALGVDGCRAGWIAVEFGVDAYRVSVLPDFRAVLAAAPEAAPVLVDIPIGLPDAGSPVRACDSEARALLPRNRTGAVFPTPCREAVYAESRDRANAANERVLGKGISAQTWAIVPKIREVDRLLRDASDEQSRVREVHPEVCFWALNGREAMRESKKSRPGFESRLRVLKSVDAKAEERVKEGLLAVAGYDAGPDDVLDGYAAALTGHLGRDSLRTLPETPRKDAEGLPKAMVYYEPGT